MVSVLQFVSDVERTWKSAGNDPFAEAGDAFEAVCQNLASATLEPYQDYVDSTGAFRLNATAPFVPDHLTRRSDLDFICGPSAGTSGLLTASGRTTSGCGVFFLEPQGYTQTYAHTGLESLLNARGYFVEFSNDTAAPAFLQTSAQRWRWRLKQIVQPAESLQVFALTSSSAWVQQLTQRGTVTPILADNVIALIILPDRAANDTGAPLSPDFHYDSRDASSPLTRDQLPPRLRLALVAIDETSAQILSSQYGSNPPALVPGNLFQAAAQLDADLTTLDSGLTSQKIGHRIFQREIQLTSSAWSNTPSQ